MGFVKALTPAVLGIARRNKTAGNLAYSALAGTTKISKTAKNAGKYLPIVGAAATAYGAYAGYNDAIAQGQDPGRAAFKGIGGVAGGALGALGGSALGGPVGGFAGYAGGGYVGENLALKAYDMMAGEDKPAVAPMSVQEQRAYRQQMRRRNQSQQPQGKYQDIAGFRYTEGVDPVLVGMRLQQQAQNINAMGGYSTAKHLSNNQLRGTLGQQYTDRFGIGQLNQTERSRIMQDNITARYGIAREADVENRRTQRDTTLGLGNQYTQRFLGGKQYDTERSLRLGQQYTQRYLGGKQSDTERAIGLGQQYTQRYLGGRQADVQQRLGLDSNYTQRYLGGKQADVQQRLGLGSQANERYGLETARQLGGRDIDLRRYDLEQGYGLKERERKDKRYGIDVEAGLRRQQLSNAYDMGMFGAIAGMYR